MSRRTFASRRDRTCRTDDAGASAVEYGLIVFAIAAVIVVITFALGRLVNETYSDTCEAIDGQVVSAAGC